MKNQIFQQLLAEGKVIAVLAVETRDRQLWQKARINHGELYTDEWFQVDKRPVGRPPANGKPSNSIDWPSVDWNKSSRELCLELNVHYSTVNHARMKFGHPKVGTRKTRHIDWSRVDWSKNNQQIAGELGIMPGSVAGYRQRLGRPSNGYTPRVISNEMIEAADWVNTKDVTIARQWGVSRERVRQIRLVQRKPRCVISSVVTTYQDIEKWLLANKDFVSGKLASEVAEMCPVVAAIDLKYRVMKKVDIQFLWRRHKTGLAATLDVNWDIPNDILSWIWNKCDNWAAINRYRYKKPKAKYFRGWRTISQEDFAGIPELLKAVRAELEKARKVGLRPNIKELQEYGFDVV